VPEIPAGASGERWFPRLQANLLDGAAASGARLVSFRNLWMYGPTGGRVLSEDLPHRPWGPTRGRAP
jgi:hypothetical protein